MKKQNLFCGTVTAEQGKSVLHLEVLESTNDNECTEGNMLNVDPAKYFKIGASDNLSYLSSPFSIGRVTGDEFAVMSSDAGQSSQNLTPDQRYEKNLDLKDGQVYLRKIVDSLCAAGYKDRNKDPITWNAASSIATVNLMVNDTSRNATYSANGGYYKVNAEIVNNRLVVNKDSLFADFGITSIPQIGSIMLDISMVGEYNDKVYKVQVRLAGLGYVGKGGLAIDPDGKFGENTQKAVNDFKRINGLLNEGKYWGKVGTTTWDWLFSVNAKRYVKEADNSNTNHIIVNYRVNETETASYDITKENIKNVNGKPLVDIRYIAQAFGGSTTWSSLRENNRTCGILVLDFYSVDKQIVLNANTNRATLGDMSSSTVQDLPNLAFEAFIGEQNNMTNQYIRADVLEIAKALGFGNQISQTRLPDGSKQYCIDATRIPRNMTGWKSFGSFTVSMLPVVGDMKDAQEAVTGVDLITGESLAAGEQVITAICVFMSVVSGKQARVVKKGFVKKATKTMAGAMTKAEALAAQYGGKNIVGKTFREFKPTQEFVNWEKVEQYVQRLNDGEQLPAIDVYQVAGKEGYGNPI